MLDKNVKKLRKIAFSIGCFTVILGRFAVQISEFVFRWPVDWTFAIKAEHFRDFHPGRWASCEN